MKYRVYYVDKPGSRDFEVEAPDHRAAAQQFFSERPRSEHCRIGAESINTIDYRDFDATEFMDEATRASLPPLPAWQTTPEWTPMAPIPGLAPAFRVLAVLEFIVHKPLLGPTAARNWKRGDNLIDWGRPFSFPAGKGANVTRALIEFKALPDDFEAAAQRIYDNVGRWLYLFEQYVALLTEPKTRSRVPSATNHADRIEILADDGHELRHIQNDKPRGFTIYMSETDESLHLENLKEACRLSSVGVSPRLEYQLMLEAYSARRNADYRKAIIEAATALEVSLTNRALEEFRTLKISFGTGLLKKFRTLNGRLELVRLLSIPFPEKDYKSLIVDPRNYVVHKADFPGERLTDQVIAEVEQLLRLFSPQLHQDENSDKSS